LLVVVSAAFAGAQTSRPAAPQAASVEPGPRSTWRFQLYADGTWYENAYFLGPTASETAWSTNGRATLGYERRFRTGTFSLAGYGGGIYYPDVDEFNQPIYGGTFGLAWTPSRRTVLKLGQDYNRSNTRQFGTLDVEGLPLPTSGVEYATSTLGYEQRLSRRWQLAVDGTFEARRYEDEGLADGDQVLADVRLGPQVGRQGLLYLGYGYVSAWFDTGTFRAHQVLIGGHKKTEKGVGFELAGGVAYVESAGEYYPAGRAGLTAVGRRARLALLYNRDFGQAYGYGRQMVSDIASATFTWTPTRRLSFDAGYNAGYRRDPLDDAFTIRSGVASGGFTWDVGGGVDFGARYSWERNETEGFPAVEGGRAMATLSYEVVWR
jgi:hypothetical protein